MKEGILMKTIFVRYKIVFLIAVVFLAGFTSPVCATLISDIDVPDKNLTNENPTYWVGSDNNSSDKNELVNSNPTTEEAWLEAILGKEYNDPNVNYSFKIPYGDIPLSSIVTGFGWQYAVVKHGAYWTAFENNFDGGSSINNVSHITYFNAAPVPEPVSMLLFGTGLVVFSFARRIKKA